MGEIARAAPAFRQELALDPTDFESSLNIGVLAKQDQEYSDARLYLERALKSRPGDPGVRYQLALLELATGGLDQVRKALEALIGESPGFAEVHGTLATVYYRLDRAADMAVLDTGQSFILTYWPSEFSQVRGQYRRTAYGDGPTANELLFQFQFSIGAHGAHPF